MTMPFRVRRKWRQLELDFLVEEKKRSRSIPADLHQFLLATTDGTIRKALLDEGDDFHEGKGWWYLPDKTDKVRPLLVAHVDTLCKPFPPSSVFIDEDRQIWSPDGILGADDRAGVAAVMELRRKHGVAVLLCDGEEAGGWGATNAANAAGDLILQHPYMVELDRQGFREVVFYRSERREFKNIFSGLGYWEFGGSFSDIAILSRRLGLPGANVSIGFRQQHTKWEFLHLGAYEDTITRLGRLIEENLPYSEPKPVAKEVPRIVTPPTEDDIAELHRRFSDDWHWRGDEFFPGSHWV